MGYYGVVEDDIRFCVHPDHQKKGIGTKMLKHLKERHPGASAIVKLDNEPSLKVFKKVGYKEKYTLVVFENEDN